MNVSQERLLQLYDEGHITEYECIHRLCTKTSSCTKTHRAATSLHKNLS